ncbi:MAG: glycoside hydrolase [Muribaculaceae bacterium]|nr:glycoside hydrolase [Muribaculaceae bacterium]
MKITSKLLLAALVAGVSASAAVAQESASVTISVNKTTGSLTTSGTSTFSKLWSSTSTSPVGVTFSCGPNNMTWAGNNLDARTGSSLSSTYTIAATKSGWYVSAYSFTAKNVTAGSNVTVTANDKQYTTSDAGVAVSISGIPQDTPATVVLSGPNTGTEMADFKVTLTQGETGAQAIVTTTITNGEFAEGTPWYIMQLGNNELLLNYVANQQKIPLETSETKFADTDLWCFTGNETDGYQIYNKAAGAGKMFAAPKSMGLQNGDGVYPRVMEPGNSSYCYDWMFTESSNLSGKTSYYISEKGNTAATLNNFGGKGVLAFWTAGKDAGSSIQITWAQQLIDVDLTTGHLNRTDGKASSSYDQWVSDDFQGLVFSTTKNNIEASGNNFNFYTGMERGPWSFTTPMGKHVAGYSFDYAKSGSWSEGAQIIAPDGKATDVTAAKQTLSVEGLTPTSENAFQLVPTDGSANKPVAISNFKVLLRRNYIVRQIGGTIVFPYRTAADVCYRIPSITTVEAGQYKGRLVALNDYRYSGVDIGGGRIDLYMSVSDDNGKTWSTPGHMYGEDGKPVAQGTGKGAANDITSLDCGYGDPAMVSDRETGEILAIACCGHTGFWNGRRASPQPSARWWSKDGGNTWTQPDYGQWEQIYALFDGTCQNGYIDSQFVGSGRMVQSRYIKVGSHYRIYCVMSGYHAASGNVSNWVLYSDDFGHNWHVLGNPMTPPVSSSADEPKCEELPDGSVLMAGRRSGGNRNFNIFRYTDLEKAEGDWMTPVATNMGQGNINACNGEVMIVPARKKATGEQCYMVLQSFPYGGGRNNVSIVWKPLHTAADFDSPECFTTWNGRYQVSVLPSAYSTMCWQHDNTLGFLYEEEAYAGRSYSEVYANLTIETITGGEYEYCADEDGAVRIRLSNEMIQHRLETESKAGEPGKYVGQPDGEGNALAEEAAANYEADPSYENYILFNKAIKTGGSIALRHGGTYSLLSAHSYSGLGDRYLCASVSGNVLAVSATNAATSFVVMHKQDSENWVIYHPATKRFLTASPAGTQGKFSTSADPYEAAEYIIRSTREGHSSLACVTPGNTSYPAIHLAQGGTVTNWTADAGASQWYMAFEGMAEELPDLNPSGVAEITADGANAPVRYFDVTGREVMAPARGQLLITSDRRKIIF